jgi:hypothetical protein
MNLHPGLHAKPRMVGRSLLSDWVNPGIAALRNCLPFGPTAVIEPSCRLSVPPFLTVTVVNNLLGSGGTFGMSVNLPAFLGDLVVVQNTSQGAHAL